MTMRSRPHSRAIRRSSAAAALLLAASTLTLAPAEQATALADPGESLRPVYHMTAPHDWASDPQRPIWVEPKTQLTDDDYAAFYQHLSHRTDEQPLWRLHLSSDSPLSFHAILYCPPTNFERKLRSTRHGMPMEPA